MTRSGLPHRVPPNPCRAPILQKGKQTPSALSQRLAGRRKLRSRSFAQGDATFFRALPQTRPDARGRGGAGRPRVMAGRGPAGGGSRGSGRR